MLSRFPKLRLAAISVALFTTVIAVAYGLSTRFALPNYGAWTGIQPLETKIEMLEEFARHGDVDVLAIGSSIVDFGFNAEHFSELMTRETGKPFRAFNFATGGAQLRTLPKLYRLARTVTKPKNVFVMVPMEPKLPEHIVPLSPDNTLRAAPVMEVIYHPFLLSVTRFLRSTPLMRNAPAIRDLALYGGFETLQSKIGMEAYAVDPHGDRISYLMTWDAPDLPKSRKQFEHWVYPYATATPAQVAKLSADPVRRKAEFYLATLDLDAIRELRDLVEGDGGKLYVFSHGSAATFWGGFSEDPQYRQARADFYDALSTAFGAKFLDPAPYVNIPTHAVSDITHLNTYGSLAYTRGAFGAFTGKPPSQVAEVVRPPPDNLFPTKNPSFTVYSALLYRPAGVAHALLHFRLVTTRAVPAIPPGDLSIALRAPDNTDIVTLAAEIGNGDYVAEVALPASDQIESYVLRLVTGPKSDLRSFGNPVADYEWLDRYPRLVSRGVGKNAKDGIDVLALPPSRVAGESLYIAANVSDANKTSKANMPNKPLPPQVELRLVPETKGNTELNLGKIALRTDGLVKVPLPAKVEDGGYTLDVRDAATGAQLVSGQRVLLAARDEPVNLVIEGTPSLAEGQVVIGWSGIRKPTAQDWIGLFPAGGKDETRLGFQFTNGKRDGKMQYTIHTELAPKLASGDYEFRAYAAGGWTPLARSEPFRFQVGEPKKDASASANGGTAATPASAASSATAAANDTARVVVDASTVPQGHLLVKWSEIAHPDKQDWVGLFPVGGAETTRISFLFLSGVASGEIALPVPRGFGDKLATGAYEVRLFTAGRWDVIGRSDRITAAPAATTAPATTATPAATPATTAAQPTTARRN